jgi:hypothetical protein
LPETPAYWLVAGDTEDGFAYYVLGETQAEIIEALADYWQLDPRNKYRGIGSAEELIKPFTEIEDAAKVKLDEAWLKWHVKPERVFKVVRADPQVIASLAADVFKNQAIPMLNERDTAGFGVQMFMLSSMKIQNAEEFGMLFATNPDPKGRLINGRPTCWGMTVIHRDDVSDFWAAYRKLHAQALEAGMIDLEPPATFMDAVVPSTLIEATFDHGGRVRLTLDGKELFNPAIAWPDTFTPLKEVKKIEFDMPVVHIQ